MINYYKNLIMLLCLLFMVTACGTNLNEHSDYKETEFSNNEIIETPISSNFNDDKIDGTYRAFGYLDTAYFEIDNKLNFVSYYASGIEENSGKLKKIDDYNFDLITIENDKLMSIVFSNDYQQFNTKENTDIKYIKDNNDALLEQEVISKIEVCLYMFNEVITEKYSTEFYDEFLISVFDSNDSQKQTIPSRLIDPNSETPDGLYCDQLARFYYLVYNFDSKDELYNHLDDYFTDNFLLNFKNNINDNFIEFDNKLYLVRGGRGYGAETIDFDSFEIDTIPTIDVSARSLLFGEPYLQYEFEIIREDDLYKIDSFEFRDLVLD